MERPGLVAPFQAANTFQQEPSGWRQRGRDLSPWLLWRRVPGSRQHPGLAVPSPRRPVCVFYFDGKTARNLQTGTQHLRFVSNLRVYGFATLNAPFLRRSLLSVCVYSERVCALCWGPHNCQPAQRNGTPSWFPSPENHPVWDWVRVVVSKHQFWVSLAEEG